MIESGGIAGAPVGLFHGRRVVIMVTSMMRICQDGEMPKKAIVLPERLFRNRKT